MNQMVTTDWERRSRNGGLIAIGGGFLTVVGVFLPWITGGGDSLTGWELYDLRQEAGENPFLVDRMFDSTFDPYVTGAPMLVFGGLLVVIGIAVYVAKLRPPPSRYRISPSLYITGMLVGIGGFMAVVLNVYSTLGAPDFIDVSMGVGLIVSGIGVIAAILGIGRSAARRGDLAAAPAVWPPQAPTTAQPQPAAGAPQPPNWYPDPAGHHQMRYWDGTSWSSHVSDNGVPSEDPLVPAS
jgi:hypothetical protein